MDSQTTLYNSSQRQVKWEKSQTGGGCSEAKFNCIWQNFSHFKIMLLHLDDKVSFLLKEYYVQWAWIYLYVYVCTHVCI